MQVSSHLGSRRDLVWQELRDRNHREVLAINGTLSPLDHMISIMSDGLELPSLSIVAEQVASERETINAHTESLDAKAGVVLGFAGVLVGLGATAQAFVSTGAVFKAGLAAAVVAALLAAWAFLPRRYPVLEVYELREDYLGRPEADTRLRLLDTQIEMIRQSAALLKQKGFRIRLSVGCLAIATALVVAGTLVAGG